MLSVRDLRSLFVLDGRLFSAQLRREENSRVGRHMMTGWKVRIHMLKADVRSSCLRNTGTRILRTKCTDWRDHVKSKAA